MKATLNQDLIKDMFRDIAFQHVKLFELTAVWMPSEVKTSREIKRRLMVNDEICLSNGIIVNCYGDPEYKIVGIKGTLDNSVIKMELEKILDKSIKIIDIS